MARPEVTGKSTADEDVFLPAGQVQRRYGVTAMSIHRWLHNAKLNFPKPMYIGRFRYWKLSELASWERDRAREAA
jgi:predicted DNA-binding transcriptional regulator AlpA